jgi:hypothetical protein
VAAPTGPAQAPVRRHPSERYDVARHRATPLFPQPFSPGDVDAALRELPSHGWTAGWTGRRDRALLVLSHMAGLSYDNIATLTVGDITVSDGVATIRTPGGTTTLRQAEDGLLCGPCALARWLHALDLTTLYPNGLVIAAVIARAVPLTADSPHLCQGTVTVTESTRRLTLMAASDQWGLCDTGDIEAQVAASSAVRPGRGLAGRIPSQRSVAGGGAVEVRETKTIWSDRRPESDDMAARFDRLALGLEGRARQLLGGSSTDLADA